MAQFFSLAAGIICTSLSCPLLAAGFLDEPDFEYLNTDELVRNRVIGQPRMTVQGEIRTVDQTEQPVLWGEGRHGVARYGKTGVESGLCQNGNVEFGLSSIAVDWGDVTASCPAGTWVCTLAERGNVACNTTRTDAPGFPDSFLCDGTPVDLPADNHNGWVNHTGGGNTFQAVTQDEEGLAAAFDPPCDYNPVWCCSEVQP